MAYIVDGNNVMGQTPGWHRDKPAARRRLLERVATFVRLRRVRVTVVFDGAPDHEAPDGSAFRGVKVFYAARGSNADARIVQLVDSSSDARGLTIVTSDRHLAFLVHSSGARVLRSGEFRKLLEAVEASDRAPEDGEDIEPGDTDAWLRYFGAVPGEEEQPDDDLGGGKVHEGYKRARQGRSLSRRHSR